MAIVNNWKIRHEYRLIGPVKWPPPFCLVWRGEMATEGWYSSVVVQQMQIEAAGRVIESRKWKGVLENGWFDIQLRARESRRVAVLRRSLLGWINVTRVIPFFFLSSRISKADYAWLRLNPNTVILRRKLSVECFHSAAESFSLLFSFFPSLSTLLSQFPH